MSPHSLEGTEVEISADAARELTDRIKVGVEGVWLLVKAAYESRAWAALGYASWDDYCTREFGASRIRLPREERTEVVASLRESGLSIRAITAATGLGIGTVARELEAPVPNGTPAQEEKVTGTDGKTYQARPTAMERLSEAARKHPIPKAAEKTSSAVRQREARLREMADAGYRTPQIAAELGMSEGGVSNMARRIDVTVVADQVAGKARQIDSNRVVSETVSALEGLSIGLGLIAADQLDVDRAGEWMDSLKASLKVLNRLQVTLKELAR